MLKRYALHLAMMAAAVLFSGCATAPTNALDATYTAAASVDGAIKAADVAVNSGALKGATAVTTIRALGTAKAAVQAAIAAQVAASGAK